MFENLIKLLLGKVNNIITSLGTKYDIYVTSSVLSPADGDVNFFGNINIASKTTGGVRRIYMPRACTITSFYGTFLNGGLGTAETSSVHIMVDNTTAHLVSDAVVNNTTCAYFSNTALAIPVAAGSYIEVRWTAPTWATNPTSVIPAFRIGVGI